MPFKQPKADKLFYSIGEVADIYGIKTSTLRFWEKEFSSLKPKKNSRGTRFFTKKDIEHIGLVYHLLKERGMTIKGAQKKMSENRGGVNHSHEIIKKLQQIKAYLLEVKGEL